jgi:hypothetical protein
VTGWLGVDLDHRRIRITPPQGGRSLAGHCSRWAGRPRGRRLGV